MPAQTWVNYEGRSEIRNKVEAYLLETLYEDGKLKHFDEPVYTSWTDLMIYLCGKFSEGIDEGSVFQALIAADNDLNKSGYILSKGPLDE